MIPRFRPPLEGSGILRPVDEERRGQRPREAAATPVRGGIDEPTGRSPLRRAVTTIRGWAWAGPVPVAWVALSLDGQPLARAALGHPRSDVAAFLGVPEAARCGFQVSLDLSGVIPPTDRATDRATGRATGRARLEATAVLAGGDTAELPPVDLTFLPAHARSSPAPAAGSTPGAPRLLPRSPGVPEIQSSIDEPAPRADLPRGVVRVRGWVVASPAPVARVELSLEGRPLGRASLGLPRPDVAAARGRPDAGLSGFELLVDTTRPDLLTGYSALRTTVALLDGTVTDLAPLAVTLPPRKSPKAAPAPTGAPAGRGVRPGPGGQLLWVLPTLNPAQDAEGALPLVQALVEHFAEHSGLRSTVVAAGDGPGRDRLEAAGATVRLDPGVSAGGPAPSAPDAAGVAAWAAAQADAVLAMAFSSFPAVEVARRLGLPALLRVGVLEPPALALARGGHPTGAGTEGRVQRAVADATLVVCTSAASRRALEGAGYRGRIAVLPDGVPTAGGTAGAAAGAAAGGAAGAAAGGAAGRAASRVLSRAERRLPADARVLVCADPLCPGGRGCPQGALVAALEHLRGEEPGLLVVLAGDGSCQEALSLRQYAEANRLDDVLRMVPAGGDLAGWWRAADAAICLTAWDGPPGTLLAAMAAGLPAIGVAPAAEELIEEGATGWLCQPDDVASLLGALTRAATTPADRLAAMGRAAAERVPAAHDPTTWLGRMTALVEGLLGR